MVTAIEVIVNSTYIVSFDVALIIVKNHASLENLDYEHSGHTGFASSAALANKADKSELTPKLDKNNFGWVIADNTYNPTYSYNKGDTVFYVDTASPYRGYIYVAKQDIPAPAGNFDYSKWETTTLERLIWLKQDKLTAGTGISIIDNVISAIGGGGDLFDRVEKVQLTSTLTISDLTTFLTNGPDYDTLGRGRGVVYLWESSGTNVSRWYRAEVGTGSYSYSQIKIFDENGYWELSGNGKGSTTVRSIISDQTKYHRYQSALESGTTIKTIEGISLLGSGNINICEVIETGALVKKLYNDIKDYKLIFCYGYRDALSAPNQFMFAFMPDQLQVDGEDLQFLAMAGPSNWQYPIRVKRNSDGYVYWWSAYDYGGNTTFFVTKILGVR